MLKAIETHYAGCRFRSRLEARYAVAFDHLGIKWEYEAQGLQCTQRISNWYAGTPVMYLPDFWLPDYGLFVEVKGSLPTEESLTRVVDCAASLSENYGGHIRTPSDTDTLVLGPLTGWSENYLPWHLHMVKGSLYITPWGLEPTQSGYADALLFADDAPDPWLSHECGDDGVAWQYAATLLLEGFKVGGVRDPRWLGALRAAKSARFEHGESG